MTFIANRNWCILIKRYVGQNQIQYIEYMIWSQRCGGQHFDGRHHVHSCAVCGLVTIGANLERLSIKI